MSDEVETKNARIKSTHLGKEDHGIMTAFVHLDYGGAGQGFGGHCLGGVFTDLFVQGVLNATKVESWEKLPGTPVRVKADYGRVYAIGHFMEDRWFTPSEVFDAYKAGVSE